MTNEELRELLELRDYKRQMEANRNQRAFSALQDLVDRVNFDPIMSPKAFRVLAECILALREESK